MLGEKKCQQASNASRPLAPHTGHHMKNSNGQDIKDAKILLFILYFWGNLNSSK